MIFHHFFIVKIFYFNSIVKIGKEELFEEGKEELKS